ncbi:hypothetical protein QJS66_23240 [Kocuria rhizophila]|nr:hypothetical protein QJS66_23240 [Kocuria rhizophila]
MRGEADLGRVVRSSTTGPAGERRLHGSVRRRGPRRPPRSRGGPLGWRHAAGQTSPTRACGSRRAARCWWSSPGTFSEVEEALDGADTVLVTRVAGPLRRPPCLGRAGVGTEHSLHAPAAVVEELSSASRTPRACTPVRRGRGVRGRPVLGSHGGQHTLSSTPDPHRGQRGCVVDEHHVPPRRLVHGSTRGHGSHRPGAPARAVVEDVRGHRLHDRRPGHHRVPDPRRPPSETAAAWWNRRVRRFANYGTSYRHLSPRESVEITTS